mmetsp:Transcript_13755/g.58218  ORF Transcript_13755/g.58218 Transcript_13755/m.58218 type:complete len:229 (-) Transcript_13755:1074-1760(-)
MGPTRASSPIRPPNTKRRPSGRPAAPWSLRGVFSGARLRHVVDVGSVRRSKKSTAPVHELPSAHPPIAQTPQSPVLHALNACLASTTAPAGTHAVDAWSATTWSASAVARFDLIPPPATAYTTPFAAAKPWLPRGSPMCGPRSHRFRRKEYLSVMPTVWPRLRPPATYTYTSSGCARETFAKPSSIPFAKPSTPPLAVPFATPFAVPSFGSRTGAAAGARPSSTTADW